MILNIVFCILSYFLGNILGGKIITYIYKEDFTTKGSFNIGARNAGRVLGAKAFFFVVSIDFFKGFLVVILLKLINASALIISIAILMVILGHIKPILNKFKGGKGVATFLGVMAALSPNIAFVFILGFLLIAFMTRSATIGFYSTLPLLVYIYYLDFKNIIATLVFAFVIFILFKVSTNDIKESFDKYFLSKA